jgi:hypothetical protein
MVTRARAGLAECQLTSGCPQMLAGSSTFIDTMRSDTAHAATVTSHAFIGSLAGSRSVLSVMAAAF